MTYFLAYKPLWIFIGLSILAFISLVFVPLKKDWIAFKGVKKYAKSLIFLGSLILIFDYVSLVLLYARNLTFIDHVEPSIAAVSWIFQQGQPLYHNLDTAERYSSSYGPMLYLINGWFLKILGANIPSAKLSGVLSAIWTLVFTFYTQLNVVFYQKAILVLAYTTVSFICLGTGAESFWNRGDPIIVMGVALGLLVVVRTNAITATLLSALVIGISVNIKIHAILYLLPILALLYSRYGLYCTSLSLLGSLLITIIPFLSPQVSFQNYVLWLREASQHGFLLRKLIDNIEWLIYLIMPLILTFLKAFASHKTSLKHFVNGEKKYYIFSLLFSAIAVVILASKAGAGRHHLLPFIPLFAYLLSMLLSHLKHNAAEELKINSIADKGLISLSLALIISAACSGFLKQTNILSQLSRYPGADIVNDITHIAASHKGVNIEMGYGGKYINDSIPDWTDYELTFYRPVLVFNGNPYLIDTLTLMDVQRSGIPISQKTLAALKSCQTKIWLIPKGNPPFQLSNLYPPHQQVFSDEFKSTFLNNYVLREQSKYFDLWFCQEK